MVAKYQKVLSYSLKGLAVLFAIYALYQFYFYSPWEKVSIQSPFFLVVAFALMPLNWLLESKRWQILLKPLFNISLLNALLGVLSGLGASFLAGKTVGSALGRYWAIPKSVDRQQSVGALFISQLTQGVHTFWIGIPCTLWFLRNHIIQFQNTSIFIGCFVIVVPLVLFLIKKLSENEKAIHFFQRYFLLLKEYTITLLASTLTLGFIRYCVFTLQFVLIIRSIDPSIPFQLLLLIVPVIFLIKTISPNLGGFLDLGIRELSTLYIFEYLGLDPNTALVSALIIWGINILLPSVIGLSIRWKL
ncbi:lysylphosphatidylglycerol synthase transmembrane domain-containing protein [Flammeovirga aprica]|uniref:Flippase-like domain-containing protein n=1 Tax=Flammeovirga aprica JL-4 TaxID=694437 RepID=A0A7X9P3B5_9BACT|nr:lysylphosphatidylglycerol synthase transmembrane domain-containing protein [Flammeovirga aprica]NME68242.1 flippase-like domain-containing protein [Flammeovirga aprica JL-4]